MSAIAWSNVSGVVERNKIDRDPRHDLSSWAGCQESRLQVRHRCGERYRVQLQFDLIDVDLWQLLARSDPNQLGFVGVHLESVWLHPTVDLLDALRKLPSCDRWFEGWYTEMHLRIISVWVCYQATSLFLLMTSNSSAVSSIDWLDFGVPPGSKAWSAMMPGGSTSTNSMATSERYNEVKVAAVLVSRTVDMLHETERFQAISTRYVVKPEGG